MSHGSLPSNSATARNTQLLDERPPVPLVVFVQVRETLDRHAVQHDDALLDVDPPPVDPVTVGLTGRNRSDLEAHGAQLVGPEVAQVLDG